MKNTRGKELLASLEGTRGILIVAGLTFAATVSLPAWTPPRLATVAPSRRWGGFEGELGRGVVWLRDDFRVQTFALGCTRMQLRGQAGEMQNPVMRFSTVPRLLNTDSEPGLTGVAPSPITGSPAPDANDFSAQPPTSPENDPPRTSDSPKAGLGDRIRRRVGATFNFAKGKGRPKKCRACNGEKCAECEFTGVEPGKADAPLEGGGKSTVTDHTDAAASSPPPHGATSTVADTEGGQIFREACGAGVETFLDFADTVTLGMAERAGHSPEFSKAALAKARPNNEKIDRFSKALKLALVENNIQPKKPGTTSAIICGLGLLSGYAVLLNEFRAEAARRQREGK